ncbi:MAG: ATP-grasp domain-containing protein [Clostridia bacterium]|nr:ATP-grasp domain-containing protein [Clostridia bacterium]
MQKFGIIGASYLQLPLIRKAKAMGLETHVFAWAAGDVGEGEADHFYPISIVERERILEECRRIGIDGICSIASDLAMLTVNYVAQQMGLTSNSMAATEVSTNKSLMRQRFAQMGDPSPRSVRVTPETKLDAIDLAYPLIVKPVDRSGSRGVTKITRPDQLAGAVERAMAQGFEKAAVVEEFAEGIEYSVESLSWQGAHTVLAVTRKYTTGAPGFIETGHIEPAGLDAGTLKRVEAVTRHALTSLGLTCGASHTEIKIDRDGAIRLIEIGGRMGGDCIGSALVELSTGIDFVRAVIETALGRAPENIEPLFHRAAAVRFILSEDDLNALERVKREAPQLLKEYSVQPFDGRQVTDSSTRFGYFLLHADAPETLVRYMPEE